MVRHWTTELRAPGTASSRRGTVHRVRLVNGLGAVFTALVLVVVQVHQVHPRRLHRGHRDAGPVRPDAGHQAPLRAGGGRAAACAGGGDPAQSGARGRAGFPARPTLQALAYGRATRPSTLVALTAQISPEETRALQKEWAERDIPVDLVVLDSPYRDVTGHILDYIAHIHRPSPRDVVAVFIPEYVVGHWWEHLLHNQSALRLKARLLFRGGVMVTSVPWQLRLAENTVARDSATVYPPGVDGAGGTAVAGASSSPPPPRVTVGS
jgi:hypothetical protein